MLIFAKHAFRAEEIGAGQPDIATGSGDEAERNIAISGDRREQQIVREADVANLERLYGHAGDYSGLPLSRVPRLSLQKENAKTPHPNPPP